MLCTFSFDFCFAETHSTVIAGRSTRSKTNPQANDRKIQRQVYLDVVYFREEDDVLVDITSSDENSAKALKKAWISVNDPFLHQMHVWTTARLDDDCLPDQNSTTTIIKYKEIQLENPTPISNSHATVNDDDESLEDSKTAGAAEPVQLKAKRQKQTKVELKSIADVLKDNVAPNCVTPLAVAPCQNGILDRSSKVLQYNQEFQVDRLFFDSQRMVAMCDLHVVDDDLVTLRMPATRLHLCEADFHKERLIDYNDSEHAAVKAFQLFSAIKRALSFVKQDRLLKKELCLATEYNRKLLGFAPGKKSSVSYYSYSQ